MKIILLLYVHCLLATRVDSNDVEIAKAVCKMFSNDPHQVGIQGEVRLSQKKIGGEMEPLQFSIDVKGFERTQTNLHGFHAHTTCDFSENCDSTGGHFNPIDGMHHGAPFDSIRHVGDFGNLPADDNGKIKINMTDRLANIFRSDIKSILNVPLVIHEDVDDLGRGGDPSSLANGNSGKRLACCCIELDDGM